jgi:hypothetical protein
MIYIVRHLKTREELLLTEDYKKAVTFHTNFSDTWVNTIDADIEDIDGPTYPDLLIFNNKDEITKESRKFANAQS